MNNYRKAAEDIDKNAPALENPCYKPVKLGYGDLFPSEILIQHQLKTRNMNAIVQFRKCTLTNEELLKKVDSMTDEIYKTGKIPDRHIPARPNEDYDLLVGELIMRFNEKLSSNNHQS